MHYRKLIHLLWSVSPIKCMTRLTRTFLLNMSGARVEHEQTQAEGSMEKCELLICDSFLRVSADCGDPICNEALSDLHKIVLLVPNVLYRLVSMKGVPSYCRRRFLKNIPEDGFKFPRIKASGSFSAEGYAKDLISRRRIHFN